MNQGGKIRILVVDDHPVVRDGIRSLLGSAGDLEVVAEAEDGAAGVAAYRAHSPDVVLMDLRMPGMDGPQAIEEILRIFPSARIIVLTTYDGDEDIHRALRLGAKSYLLKDALGQEIIGAVRLVAAGKRHVPQAVAARLAERPIGRELTGREIEVLTLIGRGQSNKEIGDALGITEATVKSHVNSILLKLEANDRTEAALIALRRGVIRLS